MLFNSVDFALFLPIVFLLYWSLNRFQLRFQNTFLVAASYIFYGWWDWRFLSLIVFSSLVDYGVGIGMSRTNRPLRRKLLLALSVAVNLGFLGFFKYFNFFSENFAEAFRLLGTEFEPSRLNIILPVGISFYTFQTLSYSIDVYRKRLEPTHDIVSFLAFVSFFPQLVAGPIERAVNLLPQFYKKREFDYSRAADGMRQILWGLFKKMVIADNCARFADIVFNVHQDHTGSAMLLGALFFTFQIYGDFSGYSDIAIGTARLFGFNLMQNFAFPYFSRDIAEFWRRWHISLSTWFRDYLYIPLGGSRGGTWMRIRNIFIIFLVSGFWHGANWTFIIWGGLNALFFLPLMLVGKNRQNLDIVARGSYLPSIGDAARILLTFALTVFAWIFFRAENLGHAFHCLERIFSASIAEPAGLKTMGEPWIIAGLIAVLMIVEWFGRESKYALEGLAGWRPAYRWTVYLLIVNCVVIYGEWGTKNFIYFQF